MQRSEFVYYAKKAFAIYPGIGPGIGAAKSAPAFAAHYQRRRANRSPARAVLDMAVGAGFHLWIEWRTRSVARKFGKDRAWRKQAARIAHRRFADPNDIALFRIERAEEFDNYIRRFEDAGFNKIINPLGWSRACVLADKRAFYARCALHGIPHPAVYAIVEHGVLDSFTPADGAPLIVKPSHGEGGRGVARLPEALSRIADPEAFATALMPFIDRKQMWIVQQALTNHASLADYAMDALITARITTMRNEAGAPELVSTVLRMPSKRGPVIDNMKAGGLIMPLDFATGRAGLACKGYGGGDYARHPVSGRPINDCVLPFWSEAVALAREAHARAFPEYRLIGWDMAFTPDGPVLVEGNAKPGVLMPQRAGRKGLAGERYGELLAYNLAEAGATR